LYAGIGMDIASPESVLGEYGNIGLLLKMDAVHLAFPEEMFDAVVSFSTFEHVHNAPAVLLEITRVLKPGGLALISFEPIWSCSYGHHLHHFGTWTQLVPPWAHLLWTPQQMREALASDYPPDAPLSLEQMIAWVYQETPLNRINIRQFHELFHTCPLEIEWLVKLKEEDVDPNALEQAVTCTGLSTEELTIKGLSLLLRKQESHSLTARVQELAGERDRLAAELATLRQHLEAAEADRAARLTVIEQQRADIARLQAVVETMVHTRAYRLLRRLGRWTFVEQTLADG